ncbi:MAG TPA: DUF6788 family protein [Streptosporangiaceae bacterium]|nr:DUF6788 family protein [Streptosporangiaceae bacterium]
MARDRALPAVPPPCAAARPATGFPFRQPQSFSVDTGRPAAGKTRRRTAGPRWAGTRSWQGDNDASTRRPQRRPGQGRAAIQAALASIGFCLPGSIVIRRTRCGKPRCACKADPPALHGPCIQWTRTVKGKTVTRILTPVQYDAYAPWFASARRLRELAAELEAVSLAEMARAEGWAKITPGTPAPPRTRPVRGPNQPKTPKTPGDPLA